MANAKTTRQVTVRHTTLPNRADIVRNLSRWKGLIVGITVHWPAGCNALVEVAFGIDARDIGRVFPIGVGGEPRIALNDATKTWPLNVWLERGDNTWYEIFNYDTINPHTISVILDVETED